MSNRKAVHLFFEWDPKININEKVVYKIVTFSRQGYIRRLDGKRT